MNDELDNRRLIILPGKDPVEDANVIADALAASEADLFDRDGRLVWRNGGMLVLVNKDILIELVRKHVVTVRLVNRGTANRPHWERSYYPVEPSEIVLRALLTANSFEEGGLIFRLPKA